MTSQGLVYSFYYIFQPIVTVFFQPYIQLFQLRYDLLPVGLHLDPIELLASVQAAIKRKSQKRERLRFSFAPCLAVFRRELNVVNLRVM